MDFPEHYNTWHELAADAMKGQSTLKKLDQGLSGVDEEETVRCDLGCRMVFQSNADRQRHIKLVHRLTYE